MNHYQKVLLSIILSPISLIYGLLVSFRLSLYRFGILKSIKFSLPVISIGNLSVGGTGKTPHIEYLLDLLSPYIVVGTLSRGYKRKTTGFKIVEINNSAEEVGDEPLQFKKNFPENLVAVAENRVLAIPHLIMQKPDLQCVLLDDAFQHLAIKPALNILLTDFNDLYIRDFLLPSGRLREWRSGYKRADYIIVTKCDQNIGEQKMNEIIQKINPLPNQKIFFSSLKYQDPYHLLSNEKITLTNQQHIMVVSGIANNHSLINFISSFTNNITEFDYSDHYQFEEKDIESILMNFEKMNQPNSIILTTQKDATRLLPFASRFEQAKIPIFVLPIKVTFPIRQTNNFDESIKNFLLEYKA